MNEAFQNRPPERGDSERGDPERGDSAPAVPALTLPGWLAARILVPNETVAQVRGPTSNWPLEPYLTHPALLLVALVPATISLVVGRSLADSWQELPPVAGVLAILFVFGTLIFLAGVAGYFTRLVITDRRLLIVQGREVRSSRRVEDLPARLLLRTRAADGRERAPTIDLTAVNTLLGGEGFVDAKTILTLGKKIDKLREDNTERG